MAVRPDSLQWAAPILAVMVLACGAVWLAAAAVDVWLFVGPWNDIPEIRDVGLVMATSPALAVTPPMLASAVAAAACLGSRSGTPRVVAWAVRWCVVAWWSWLLPPWLVLGGWVLGWQMFVRVVAS